MVNIICYLHYASFHGIKRKCVEVLESKDAILAAVNLPRFAGCGHRTERPRPVCWQNSRKVSQTMTSKQVPGHQNVTSALTLCFPLRMTLITLLLLKVKFQTISNQEHKGWTVLMDLQRLRTFHSNAMQPLSLVPLWRTYFTWGSSCSLQRGTGCLPRSLKSSCF